MQTFDAIIIGTGQAGPAMAARCAEEGMKTAIIEKGAFGGTCVNTGCTPTKTMVASARAAYMAKRAADFGIMISGDIQVDLKKIKERKDAIVKESREGVEDWMENTDHLTIFRGHARFVNNHTIRVNDDLLQAEKVFINVGARPFMPDGYDGVEVLTNRSILELESVPDHLLIVGAGAIGLEFGQMFRRFGSQVTIIEMAERIAPKEDPEVSQAIQKMLAEEGIQFRIAAECLRGQMEGDTVVVELDCESDDQQEQGTHLLMAAGRVPNTDDLDLENTDIELDDNGYIQTNDSLQTDVAGIWALGDCNGKGAFTHTAYNDFEIVSANLFDNDSRRVSDRIDCYALYLDPPLARIGMSEQKARESDKEVLIGSRDMSRIARAKEKGETKGFLKILIDADTEKILGATILGIGGDEIIHSLLDVMYTEKPYSFITRAMHIHPTVSELIPTILKSLEPLNEEE